ncbi:GTPase HflX [candidate division KSB1 bacterium]|nr:GTPase HflX [candidate division KSB1 bacterium]
MQPVEGKEIENALLVGIVKSSDERLEVEEHLDELELLADTAGARVVDKIIQQKERIDPSLFLGRGKAEQIAESIPLKEIDMVIFDEDLSPAQARNLEKLFQVKVLDRTILILDIFAKRAKTREARTQVELAQLKYLLPRLTRQWTHLSRQVGGIGTRGPGETQLEVDRRLVRLRIRALSNQLQKIKSRRKIQRSHRSDIFKAALVGYTNVGKSTLLNALADSSVFVENRLFATLDPTIKAVELSNKQRMLLIDTVGFIRKLPHHLVASFRSTIEEAAEADVLLHVVDISHRHFDVQIGIVSNVLKELGIAKKPILHVFNKVDLLKEPAIISRAKEQYPGAVFVSAARGMFLDELKTKLIEQCEKDMLETDIVIEQKDTRLISRIYALAEVLEITYQDSEVILKIRAERAHYDQIRHIIRVAAPENEGIKSAQNADSHC